MTDENYWLNRAKAAAARAVSAENAGDVEAVDRHDEEYQRCLWNYYDNKAAPTPPLTAEEKK